MAKTKKPKLTEAQQLLGIHLKELGLYVMYEYQFLADRRFRFDVYVPMEHNKSIPRSIGIEIDGGKWSGGHRRGKAIEDENDKKNIAQCLGYRVLTFTNEQVNSGYAKEFVAEWVIGK